MSTIGRREFVTKVVTTTATAVVALGSADFASAAAATSIDVKTATAVTFKGAVGQTFTAGLTNLTLHRIDTVSDKNKSRRPKGIRKESFSLIFSAPLGVKLSDGIYQLKNATLGTMSVYMNEVWLPSMLSSASALGQAERFVASVTASVIDSEPKVYYEVPFN